MQEASSPDYSPTKLIDAETAINDDSVAFVKSIKEIITIEESQSTQDLYMHIADIKEELKRQETVDSRALPSKPMKVTEAGKFTIKCADCEEVSFRLNEETIQIFRNNINSLTTVSLQYHRMLGRDLKRDFPKRFGVCSKHRRNIRCAETPPGFWNPKIVDTDSDYD